MPNHMFLKHLMEEIKGINGLMYRHSIAKTLWLAVVESILISVFIV